jgi:hypothetical protein
MRALLRKAELIDAQEDSQIGRDKQGDELPEELKRRSSRLEWIRKAKAELEAEAAAAKAAQRQQQAAAADKEATDAEASSPDVTTRPVSGQHAVGAEHANGRLTPTSWPSRQPRRPALSRLPSLQLGEAIRWRCHLASCRPMRPETPNPRLRETSQTLTATFSRDLTVGSRGTTPRPLSMAITWWSRSTTSWQL